MTDVEQPPAGHSSPARTPDATAPAHPAHDAFISYSRKDTAFAARLQQALEKYTPPPGLGRERRRLRVFRDQHDFTGTEYYASIQRHLAGARKLIVVCSPDAAASPYVDDEIRRFVELHGAADLLPVLWRGLPNNETAAGQEGERAFPIALAAALQMPLAADFRGADPRARRIDGGAHDAAWMLLLANLLEVSRAEIEQRERRRRRRTRRIWATGIGAVFVALLTLALWALFEGERALGRQLAAQAALAGELDATKVERRTLVARESVQRLALLGEPTLDAESALRDALAETPVRRLALPAAARTIAFSADGNYLLAAEGPRLLVHPLAGRGSVRESPLTRPLLSLASGPDHHFVAGVDDAGAVRVWSWPELASVTALPPQVAGAPVQCLAFADAGAVAVALRVTSGKTSTAELLQWQAGDTALIASASVAIAQPLQARGGDACLMVRPDTMSGETALASLEPAATPDGSNGDRTVLSWTLRRTGPMAVAALPVAAIAVRAGVALAELDQNARPVLLLPDGELIRAEGLGERRVKVVPQWTSPEALAFRGAWLAVSQGLEDPYVPLLKSRRFDIVDTSNGAVVQSVGDHAGLAVFTPDASTLVTVSGARLRLWDRRDGRERLRIFAAAPVERVLFDPSSRQLAAVADGGGLEVFGIGAPDETVRAVPRVLIEPLGGAEAVAVGAGRDLFFTSSNGTPPRRLQLDHHVLRMQASPDGRSLILGVSKDAPMFGTPSQAETWVLQTGDSPSVRWRGVGLPTLRFDGASRTVLAVGDDGQVRMLDLSRASVIWERRLELKRSADNSLLARVAVALSDDGGTAAVGSTDGLVLLSGRDGSILRRDAEPTYALALSADGGLVARLASNDRIEVLRARDGSRLAQLDRRGLAAVRALVFSPGATRLMAIGGTSFSTFMGGNLFAEEHVVVWNLENGQPELRVPDSRIDATDYQTNIGVRADERRQLTGLVWSTHTRAVAGMLFPSMLAYWTVPSTLVRGRLTAWQLTDKGLVEIYRGGDREYLKTEAFAAGGWALTVTGDDDYRRVIDVSRDRLVAASCAAVQRRWTDDERSQYLSGIWRRPLGCPAN